MYPGGGGDGFGYPPGPGGYQPQGQGGQQPGGFCLPQSGMLHITNLDCFCLITNINSGHTSHLFANQM